MRLETMKLENSRQATLTVYLHDITELRAKPRPIILIAPGGGYGMVSEREAEPVAIAFYNAGYHAAILRYSVGEDARDMQPMVEALDSIRILREHSGEWRIAGDKIAVCGFSAGGHLAASTGTMWNEPALMERLNGAGDLVKPNALILGYPVITSGEFAHRGSFHNLTGSHEDDDAARFFSIEKRVTSGTPPTFLWHTEDDSAVTVENALLMISALRKNQVPFECHIFNKGQHGLSMCNEEVHTPNPHCAHWFGLCIEWLDSIGLGLE
ncbi:alpha/beta hydrolase [Paenibacillus sp. BK720]|uniref:alpha/beta hydrolase n=1 Tax=Paenibacillus sp. BK720 TaxID=2587092 RepID=UPI00141F17CC|nr:alpha/beta hydrolase [Paenibacillus sp. BK720]NIK70821.1 acetyl esterase/lipase [Paenibacillus sp. BK720]